MAASREFSLLLLAGLAAGAMLVPAVVPSWGLPLRLMEWRLQDYIHSQATPAPARNDLVILGIDDASLEMRSAFDEDVTNSKALQLIKQGWPWSREVYALAIPKLLDAGAKAVMLDLMFTGPSSDHPDGDAALQKVIAEHPNKVILAANFTNSEGFNGPTGMLQKPWSGLVADTNPPAPNIGFITYWPDQDQVVRWVRFQRSMVNEDSVRPDLAYLDQIPSAVTATLRAAGFGRELPADDQLHWPRFGNPQAYAPLSLHEIFVPDLWDNNFAKGAAFKDKIIFIGPAAAHLHDDHRTPVGSMLGIQVHAQVAAAALDHRLLKLLPSWVSVVLILAGAAVAWALVAFWRRPIETMLALIVGTLGGLAVCWALFNWGNLVVDAVAPLLAFNLAGLLGVSYDFMLERRRQQQFRGYLERYFSPDVVDLMVRDPDHFRTLQRGASRTITILFMDLRDFTSLSENLTPEQLVKQLNQYFNRMVSIIHGNSGGIDKFIGDAIMAIWGWVGSDTSEANIKQTAVQAVTTTLRMREGLRQLNEEWTANGMLPLKFGVGIHQGEVVVGDLGSEKQSGFTVIGDSVNIASRLESITKQYGVDNIISDTVRNQVAGLFICRSVDLVRVKGKLIPVPIYTVIKEVGTEPPPGLEVFEEAILRYRSGEFQSAKNLFEQAIDFGLDDQLTTLYIQRCNDLLAAPPSAWDGVFVMNTK